MCRCTSRRHRLRRSRDPDKTLSWSQILIPSAFTLAAWLHGTLHRCRPKPRPLAARSRWASRAMVHQDRPCHLCYWLRKTTDFPNVQDRVPFPASAAFVIVHLTTAQAASGKRPASLPVPHYSFILQFRSILPECSRPWTRPWLTSHGRARH